MDISSKNVQELHQSGQGNFQFLISKIIDKKTYEKALREANKRYKINKFKVSNMTPVRARKIYPLLLEKYRKNLAQQQSWLENQRQLFIWLVLCYASVSQKAVAQLVIIHLKKTPQQLLLFSQVFNHKSVDFLKFQVYALQKRQKKSTKWTFQQDKILLKIISESEQQVEQKEWNNVSKQFFQQSSHKLYRSSKQCRQRWMNHLDPNKIKGVWTRQQDLVVLKFVLQKGKKWSQIVRDLDGCKTQHMVKNRFNSLINKKGKQIGSIDQQKILSKLIQQLQCRDAKYLQDQFRASQKADSFKSDRDYLVKEERTEEAVNTFQHEDGNNEPYGKKFKFFVRRAGSLSMSERGGLLPDLVDPILEQMDSEQQIQRNTFMLPRSMSERGGQVISPYLISSPLITGNGENVAPSLFFLEQNTKGSGFYGSDLGMSFSSNFDKFIP